jgi:hypothetical protein
MRFLQKNISCKCLLSSTKRNMVRYCSSRGREGYNALELVRNMTVPRILTRPFRLAAYFRRFFLGFPFYPWERRQYDPGKCLKFSELGGVKSQKTAMDMHAYCSDTLISLLFDEELWERRHTAVSCPAQHLMRITVTIMTLHTEHWNSNSLEDFLSWAARRGWIIK